MPKQTVPVNVAAVNREISSFLTTKDGNGRVVGNSKYGVYAFYDYDGEPIYVGQTAEKLRVRIRRHLTNQRTDAVAMNVLDPAEVAEIEMWPLFDLDALSSLEAAKRLNAAEYTVFQTVVQNSALGAVLNEKDIPETDPIPLPDSIRKRIIPDELYEKLKHPDTRIARRAATIANLARVISEREVSKGLRRTLLTQARRLENLAGKRLAEFGGDYPDEEDGEETGETTASGA
jgi:hypothetical protein